MVETVFSPGGKWMWTGTEWIPAPPISVKHDSDNSESEGQASDDWSRVLHLGEMIELIASEDWDYYWVDDSWHPLIRPDQQIIHSEAFSEQVISFDNGPTTNPIYSSEYAPTASKTHIPQSLAFPSTHNDTNAMQLEKPNPMIGGDGTPQYHAVDPFDEYEEYEEVEVPRKRKHLIPILMSVIGSLLFADATNVRQRKECYNVADGSFRLPDGSTFPRFREECEYYYDPTTLGLDAELQFIIALGLLGLGIIIESVLFFKGLFTKK